MAPGPKRRGKKDFSGQKGNVKRTNSPNITSENHQEIDKQLASNVQSDTWTEPEPENDNYVKNNRKYSKRQIQSNWDRYEDRSPGLFEDTLRGESFEVVASYQGGSDSYMKLKEEKEWCNTNDFQGGLCLDCDRLVESLKCIPFHKRLHLPEDCFVPEMIQKFQNVARRSNSLKHDAPLSLSSLKDDLPSIGTFTLSSSEDVISETSYKPKVISEKTENIILSLTSCVSLKDEAPKAVPKLEETPAMPTVNSSLPEPEETPDDLAFLLSLSGPDKKSLDTLEEKNSSASIEDWLNELLEK